MRSPYPRRTTAFILVHSSWQTKSSQKALLWLRRAVLLEIGNALSKQRHREAAIRLLDALEADPNVEIIPLSEQLYARALQLYRERPDKEWGLTD